MESHLDGGLPYVPCVVRSTMGEPVVRHRGHGRRSKRGHFTAGTVRPEL